MVDFWKMVWQEKVQVICMMTNLVENGKVTDFQTIIHRPKTVGLKMQSYIILQVKCDQYWPDEVGKKVSYGTISVQYSREEIHPDYICRTFEVCRSDGETRNVNTCSLLEIINNSIELQVRTL